ncbi:MAG: hypothetical protein GY854_29295 [Deltaproteobacteria bacterium]|nr:hypothetical protein [Deltaproteobacteria bacterium]
MIHVRKIQPLDPKSQHDCDRIHIDSYEMEEVVLPSLRKQQNVRAIRMVVRGRNFRAVAQPLMVLVGKESLRYLRIAPDETSVEGILLNEPEPGAMVEVHLGDQDAARHNQPVSPKVVKRLGHSIKTS